MANEEALRVVFMGTAEFAVPSLRRLVEAVEIVAVVTQPDRPRGRGRHETPPPVKTVAESLGLPIIQPQRARARRFVETIRGLAPDVIAVVAYGQILPASLLDLPPFGCVNVHPSLLPKYRGAAPIQWALWNGESETGVTVMKLDEGEDSGPILRQERVPIEPHETAPELGSRLAELGAGMLCDVLRSLRENAPEPVPQDEAHATRAPRMTRGMGQADWSLPAPTIYNRFRACEPWPGTFTYLPDGTRVRLRACVPVDRDRGGQPGTIFAEKGRLFVQTGEGVIEVRRLQLENRAPVSATDYLNGLRGNVPSRFEWRDAGPQ